MFIAPLAFTFLFWFSTDKVFAEETQIELTSFGQIDLIYQDPIQRLTLTSICFFGTDAHRMRVRNPNSFSVDYTFEVFSTTISGGGTAQSGDTFFNVFGVSTSSTIILSWEDENKVRQTTTKALNPASCSSWSYWVHGGNGRYIYGVNRHERPLKSSVCTECERYVPFHGYGDVEALKCPWNLGYNLSKYLYFPCTKGKIKFPNFSEMDFTFSVLDLCITSFSITASLFETISTFEYGREA